MSDISIFRDKDSEPNIKDLIVALGGCYTLWENIEDYVMLKYPKSSNEWKFTGKNHGWSYRIKDTKRVIIYFLPRKEHFKVAFVFGDKAYDLIMASPVSDIIKSELSNATKYVEGRGIRIKIENDSSLSDIFRLIDIKLNFR